MVGRSSVLRPLLVASGHTSTTTEADILQIWSERAVKAHHSENNLTLLLKRESRDSPSYIPPGTALQVKLQMYSMRGEFIFFLLPRSSLLKQISLWDLWHLYPLTECTQSYLCVVRPLDMLLGEGTKKTSPVQQISSPDDSISFFPIWRQNECTKDLRKQLCEIRYKGAFASLSQDKVQ